MIAELNRDIALATFWISRNKNGRNAMIELLLTQNGTKRAEMLLEKQIIC